MLRPPAAILDTENPVVKECHTSIGGSMLDRLFTFPAGEATFPERAVLKGGRLAPVTLPATVAAFRHTTEGWILFDTGYAQHVLDEARKWPEALYPWVIPFTVPISAADQLRARGVDPNDVRHVVISHLHPDHIGGLKDFPNAALHCPRRAWDVNAPATGLARARLAFMPGLLPEDFRDRVHWIDGLDGSGAGPFPATGDLFGDGSVRFVGLPGHAAGQIGAFVQVGERRALLAADSCWLSRGYTELRSPSRITYAILDDHRALVDTLSRLHHLHMSDRELVIVPSHCPDVPPLDWT
ncbi:MAG: MBL fold metallo-hydrolase [Myxococcota bacterium]